MNAKVKGTAFALFGGACWGLSSVVGKLLFDMRGMNAEWLVTARLVFGGFIMLCFAAFQKKGEIFKIWKEKENGIQHDFICSIGNAGMSAYILFMCAVFEPGDSDSASVHLAGYDYAVMPFP